MPHRVIDRIGAEGCIMLGARLICLHEGQKSEEWLWYTAFDGAVWYEDVKLQQVSGKKGSYGTSGPPALIT